MYTISVCVVYLVIAQLLNRSLQTEHRNMPSVMSNMSASSGFFSPPLLVPDGPAPKPAALSFLAPLSFVSSFCISIL